MFWKTVKPMISNKCVNRDSITLVKDGNFFLENLEITETFNVTFLNLVKEMDISLGQKLLTEADDIKYPVLRIIDRFKKHPSVVVIFENNKDDAFIFKHVSLFEKSRYEEAF